MKQLWRLLASDSCDRYAPFENTEAFGKFANSALTNHIPARHREKPTYYTIADAIESLENFAKLNCDLRAYGMFESKYIRFKDNFLAYRISG